ncbi:MAG: hypothetical protein RI965_348 [Bacteroidota bacterium]
MWLPVTPSTAIGNGAAVSFSSGKLIAATNTEKPYNIVGILKKAVAATDSDYALDRLVPVEVPVEKNVEWTFDVLDGTLAATDVGTYKDLNQLDTGLGVDAGASSLDVVFVTRFLSASKGRGVLNTGPGSAINN